MRREETSLDRRILQGAVAAIRRWDDAREGEPAHGLFLRIAARNHQISGRRFGEALGINGRYFFPDECRQILSNLAIRNPEEVDRWTPRFDGNFGAIAGVRFVRKHWTIDTRRFCPACLAESPHHRTWWDLTFMHRCPHHGLDLTDRDPHGDVVRWLYPEIDRTPDGTLLSRRGFRRLDRPQTSWEAYVLGRLGLAPRLKVAGWDLAVDGRSEDLLGPPGLDSCLDALLLLGRLELGGWRRDTPLVGSTGFAFAQVIEAGFDCMAKGPEEVRRLFDGVIAAAPNDAFGPANLFGWAHQWLVLNRRAQQPMIVDAMASALVADGRYGRSFTRFQTRVETRRMFTDCDPERVRARGERALADSRQRSWRKKTEAIRGSLQRRDLLPSKNGGDLSPARTSQFRDAVEAVRTEILSRPEAAALMGVSQGCLDAIVRAGMLPVTNGRWLTTDDPNRNPLPRESVLRLVSDLMAKAGRVMEANALHFNPFAVADEVGVDAALICRGLLSGEIGMDGITPGSTDLAGILVKSLDVPLDHPLMRALRSPNGIRLPKAPAGQLTKAQVASLLKVDAATVQALVEGGLIARAVDAKPGLRQPLDGRSALEFASRHAGAALYARAMDCDATTATLRLKRMGVADVVESIARQFGIDDVYALYERKAVRRALGLDRDPDHDGTGDIMTEFWEGFAAFLRRMDSPFSVAKVDNNVARLKTSSAKWRIDVEFERPWIRTTAYFHKTRAPERASRAVEQVAAGLRRHRRNRRNILVDAPYVKVSSKCISISGSDEILFREVFRDFLYRQILLGVEGERVFFDTEDAEEPGRMPHVSF